MTTKLPITSANLREVQQLEAWRMPKDQSVLRVVVQGVVSSGDMRRALRTNGLIYVSPPRQGGVRFTRGFYEVVSRTEEQPHVKVTK